MLEAKGKHVSLWIHPTNLLNDVVVAMSFKMTLKGCAMVKLCQGCDCCCGSQDEACVAKAIVANIFSALCGTPVATQKSKVAHLEYGAHNNSLVVSWKMKGVVSHIRKALGIALKSLNPAKLYSSYDLCMKQLNAKPKKEHFNHVVNEFIKNMKDGVCCAVVGNVKANKEVVESVVDVLDSKLMLTDAATPRTAPPNETECKSEHCTIKVAGWAAFVVQDFICDRLKGLSVCLCNNCVSVPIKESTWASLSQKLKKAVPVVVDQKYKKLGDHLGCVLAYQALANGCIGCPDAKALLKVDASAVSKVLKDAF
jgi:hypothetical protein